MRTVDDYNFMSAKQIQRLHVFSNLRRLRFFGRWRDSAWRPGPSVTLLRRLVALAESLKHLKEISVSTYIPDWHLRQRRPFRWRYLPEGALQSEEWTYSYDFLDRSVPLVGVPSPEALERASTKRNVFVVEMLERKGKDQGGRGQRLATDFCGLMYGLWRA